MLKNSREILRKRFGKLEKHYTALKDYKNAIDSIIQEKNIFEVAIYSSLNVGERAILDAYLKRFSSLQDFLGSKIFSLLLEVSGIGGSKMSEVLYNIEKEGIIDSLENWIELREIRNELEHDYPEKLEDALRNLKYCIDNFSKIESYFLNSYNFGKRYF